MDDGDLEGIDPRVDRLLRRTDIPEYTQEEIDAGWQRLMDTRED